MYYVYHIFYTKLIGDAIYVKNKYIYIYIQYIYMYVYPIFADLINPNCCFFCTDMFF